MKRFLIIGFILILLVAAPLAAYFLLKQNTNNQSHANPASSLLFEDIAQPVVVGQQFQAVVDVNPSSNGTTNAVSFVKLTISYDGSKLSATNNSLVPSAAFQTELDGPTNTCTGTNNTQCTITATLSIGSDPTKAVTSQTPVATITFTAIAPTDANAPVPLDFVQGQNQILSLASTDQPAENVFTRGISTSITIISVAQASGTPTDTPYPNQPTDTPYPTGTQATPTDTPPPSGGGGGTQNQAPVCSNLTVTQDTTDNTGMTYQLTAQGSDSDGTISKITFNFGDGAVQDVTSGNTIGTNSINESAKHTYTAAGTYTVSALLTDNQGAISSTSSCQKSINIATNGSTTSTTGNTNSTGTTTDTPTPNTLAQANTPTPTSIPANPKNIPATGPGETIIGIGLAGAALAGLGVFFLMGL